MKKIMNKINFAMIAAMTAFPAIAANGGSASGGINGEAICTLVKQLAEVFKMLRVFAFIGAAFMIAGWAWGYISKGAIGDGKGSSLDELKNKGTALIVGFVLLFAIGLIFSFLVSVSQGKYDFCSDLGTYFN
ncbi:MAG: hypothetical protein J6W40_00690 [Alphaproteobacteria bacterium]|nr:hypothetical protein [Alphaproteobacteria bacterium]